MPLVGAPGDLYTQLLASVLCKVFLQYSLLFVCIFVLWISHPSLPLEVGARLVLVGKYSTELFSVTVPGGGLLIGLPRILPPHTRALPSFTNFVGTNDQAHLLLMRLNA